MVKEQEINKGIIKDDELGEVDMNAGSELSKKLAKPSAKEKKDDPQKTQMELKLEEMVEVEKAKKDIRPEMLELKWFKTREEVAQYQKDGGMIYGHASDYPMETLVIKEEFKERFINKKKS